MTVDSLDMARIISKYCETDTVILKMDIEGAEYDLIQDFGEKSVFKLIDYIAVEFHPYVYPFKNAQQVLMSLVRLSGTKILRWN